MFNSLSINTKLFAVILAELIISSMILATYSVQTIQDMTNENISRYEKQVIEEKKLALKNYVDMAKAVLQIYRNKVTSQTTPEELQQIKNEAVKALDSMVYGDDDGYIFVWTYDGVPLAFHPRPDLIGKVLIDLKGGEGKYVIRDHIALAKKGGGHFYQYKWKTTKDSPYQTKLSYSFGVEDWQWFVGTGEYLAKEEKEIAYKKSLLQEHTNELIFSVVRNATILVLITSTILFFIIRKIIFSPLRNLSQGLESFFNYLQDKRSHFFPIPVTSNDEIGKMSYEINESTKLSAAVHEQLQEVNQQLIVEKERFELAVTGADHGLFDWDIKTDEVYYSPRWKSLIGYQDHEIENTFKEWEIRVHPDDLQQTFDKIQNYLQGKTDIYDASFRMKHKLGHWVWIQARGKASRDEMNQPSRMVGFHADITETKQLHKKLEETAQHATEANQAKSEFLANMSHEFRTPMHAILSFADLALKREENERNIRYLQNIRSSGIRLTTLLNDLLDLSKLEAGKMQASFLEQDMLLLVERVANEASGLTNEKGIQVTIEPKVHIDCMFDQKLIFQLLMNFLSNAIKFSPENSTITITLAHESILENGIAQNMVHISVVDQGVGIPSEELETIFDKFIQSSKTKTQAGGTGLGLTIAKEIVDLHHGKIWVESPPKGQQTGAAFMFRIPCLQGQMEFTSIEEVIEQHHKWHQIIKNACMNKTKDNLPSLSEITNDKLCALGHWIEAKTPHEKEQIVDLIKSHKEFHLLAGECNNYIHSEQYEAAKERIADLDKESSQIVKILSNFQ